MAITVSINSGPTSNIESYTVTEDSSPIDPSDSSGGVGQVNISVAEPSDSVTYVDSGITFAANLVTNPSMEASSGTVTVRTNLVTNPSMETVSTGSVVMRRNLVTNPSFESAVWNSSNPIVSSDSTIFRTGTKSMKLVRSSTAGTMAVYQNSGGDSSLPVVVGQNYAHSFWVYSTIASSWRVGSRWQTGISWGTGFTQTFGSIVSVPANTWTLVSGVLVAPATATYTQFFVESSSTYQTTDAAYIDSVLVEASSTVGDFFDGSTTDALGWDYAWSGTANDSISTAACAATTVRTNLITNPGFETGTTGWSINSPTTATRVNTGVGIITGSYALEATIAATSNWGLDYLVTTVASTQYIMSAYITLISGDTTGLTMEASDGSGGRGSKSIASLLVTNTPVRVDLSWTSSTTPFPTRFNIRRSSAGSSAAVVRVDAVMVEQGTTLGDYFDGSFNPAGDFSYAWTGTANASTSIQRGAAVAGWSAFTPANITQVTSQKYVGSSSLLVAATGINAGATWTVSTVAASTTYTFSAYVKGEVGKSIYLELLEQDSGGTEIGRNTGLNISMTGAWQQLSVSRTFTTGVRAQVRVRNSTVSAVHTFYVDAAMLEASPIVQDYFDGSVVSADADLTNSWSGTAHASTSLMRGATVTGYSSYAASQIQSQRWASSGSKSIRVIPTQSWADSTALYPLSTVIGTTYTVQAKIRLAAPQTGTLSGWARRITVLNGGLGQASLAQSVQATNAAGVTQLSVTFTATKTSHDILLGNGASAGNGDVWWDDLLLVEGTYTGDYFDGNSTDTNDYIYSWTGTPNASTSNKNYVSEKTVTNSAELYINDNITLEDGSNGSTVGKVGSLTISDGIVGLSGDSRLSAFIATRTANPYSGTLAGAFEYYLGLVGITQNFIVDSSIASTTVIFPGFTGIMWDYIKKMCAALDIEVSLVSNNIVLRPIRTRTAENKRIISESATVSNAEIAQNVEIYYYNNTNVVTDTMVYPKGGWDSEVPIYQVDAGQTLEVQIPVDVSLKTIVSPTPVNSPLLKTYSGPNSVYTVAGKDGLPISASAWTDNGGSITATIGEDTKTILLKIVGARDFANLAPYRIAEASDTSNSYSSLRIMGTGIFFDKQKLTIPTGVSAEKSSTLVGVTVDNEFISTLDDAFSNGAIVAGRWGSASQNINISTVGINRVGESGAVTYPTFADFDATQGANTFATFDTAQGVNTFADFTTQQFALVASDFTNQAFGNVAGARVKYREANYRIRTATISPSEVSYSAERDTIFSDVNALWIGKTFADFNTQFGNKLFEDYAVIPLWQT